jgi:hypothetical protein
MDKKVLYQELISEAIVEIGQNPGYLKGLVIQISEDEELRDEEKKELITAISLENNKLNSGGSTTGGMKRPERLFPKYSFDADDSECGLLAHKREQYANYAQWLVSEYLPIFHPLPRGDLQYPVVACFMLLNSMAAKPKSKFPIPWIQGLAGVGKSELGSAFLQHYPTQLQVEVRPEDTGASLRDRLDAKFGQGEPGIMVWDNFWIKDCLLRLGVFRSLILANCRADALSHLSTKGDNQQGTFKTHSIKVFTSVDDGKEGASSDMSEIARRLWVITCKNTGAKPPNRFLYSWEGMQSEYQAIWGHQNELAIKTEYSKALTKVARIKGDKIHVDAKIWEMMIVPLAVWQFVGLGSLDEGIKLFGDHRDWTYKQDTAQVDMVLQVVKGYLADLKIRAQSFANNPLMNSDELLSQINPQDIKQHVEAVADIKVGEQTFQKIQQMLTNYGYLYKVLNGKAVFLKQ